MLSVFRFWPGISWTVLQQSLRWIAVSARNVNLTKNIARICKRLWSPGIDSEESIPPAYVVWRAGKTNRVVVPAREDGNFLGSLKGLQIRALNCRLFDMWFGNPPFLFSDVCLTWGRAVAPPALRPPCKLRHVEEGGVVSSLDAYATIFFPFFKFQVSV